MKKNKLKKDTVSSIRINKHVLRELKLMGLSPQKILDRAVSNMFDIEMDITIKPKNFIVKKNEKAA